jgi:hypothetical protein
VSKKLDLLNQPDAAGFRPVRGEFATYWKHGRVAREVRAHVSHCWFEGLAEFHQNGGAMEDAFSGRHGLARCWAEML